MKLKKVLAVFLALVMSLSCMSITVLAEAKTPVVYKAPVYNEEGDPSSGVKEWSDGSCSEYEFISNSDRTIQCSPGWYVVDGAVTVEGSITCSQNGDINIILKDNSQLTIEPEQQSYGINNDGGGSLNIYTQSHGNECGILTITTVVNNAIYAKDGITINGGKINLTTTNTSTMCTYGELTINEGTVNAVSEATDCSNISFYNSPSALRINAGTLNVTGGEKLTSGCTISGSVTAAKEESGAGAELSNPNAIVGSTEYHHATIVPLKTRNISVGPITNGSVSADKTTGKYGDTVTVTATPAEGYKLDSIIVKDAAGGDVEVTQETGTFAMVDSDVTITAAFIKPVTLLIDSVNGDDEAERADGATYKTIAGALEKIKSDDTIKLISDVTEDVMLGVSCILDLNGYVLEGTGNSSVIASAGTLTIKDSGNTVHYFKVNADGMWVLDTTANAADYTYSTAEGLKKNGKASDGIPTEGDVIAVSGGCITGGNDSLAGGVNCTNLYLEGGNIVGNCGGIGGGIAYLEGNFIMTGGSIIGNYSEKSVGGVYGTFADLTGGRISYNSGTSGGFLDDYPSVKLNEPLTEDEIKEIEKYGYKVCGDYCCLLKVGGNIIIDNNVGGNLVVLGPLALTTPDEGLNVGVTLLTESDEEYVISGGQFTVNGTADDAKYFTSDSEKYTVKFAKSYLKLVLADPACYIDEDNDGKLGDEETTYETLADAIKAAGATESTICLLKDVNEDVVITNDFNGDEIEDDGQTITLDLNGCVLKGTGKDSVINSEGVLTIKDSGNTVHYFKVNADGMWVLDTTANAADYTYTTADGLKKDGKASDDIPTEGDVIAVSGGCITGGNGSLAGGVYCTVLYLEGGNIVGNCGEIGGGGIAYLEGNFIMTGGSIIGNYSEKSVGGVYGTFANLTGGRISYNSGASGGFLDEFPSEKSDEPLTEEKIKEFEKNGYKVCGDYICLLKVGGNIIIDNNVGGNLVVLGPLALTTPGEGLDVGVTLCTKSDKKYVISTGQFTANGTADDAKYFTSDYQFYEVSYDSKGYLKLGYIISEITGKTTDITFEEDEKTAGQAIAIATEQKPYSELSKNTVIVYAKADDFDTTGRYLTITASSSSDWQAGEAMTLAEIESDLANKDYLVIGLVVGHSHEWTYELSKTNENNDTITATCEGEGNCNYFGTDKSLTITAPASLGYDGGSHEATFGTAATFLGEELPEISYEYKASKSGTYAATEDTKKAGFYKASFTVGEGTGARTAYVEYEVTKKQLTVTGTTADEKTYDGTTTAVAHIGAVGGKCGSDAVTVEIASATFADRNAENGKKVTVTYSITGADSSNYITPANDETRADIGKKSVSVTAEDKTTYVGSDLAALTYIAGDLIAGDSWTGKLATDADKAVVGKYEIKIGTLAIDDGNDGGNYSISFTKGVYEVTAKEIQTLEFVGITGGKVTKTYGDDKFTEKVSGAKTGVTYSSSDESVAKVDAKTGEVTILKAGTAVIKAAAEESAVYAAGAAQYMLTVNRAKATVTADNQSMYLGDKVPTFTAQVTGLVGNDKITYSFNTLNPEAQGMYSIVPSGDAIQGSYDVTYVQGVLSVTKKESDAKADPAGPAEVLKKYQAKEEYKGKTLDIEVRTDQEVPEKSKTEITKVVASGKKIQFTETNLFLIIKSEGKTTEKNIGDENDTLISVTYKFDFTNKKDIQVFRGYETSKGEVVVDELAEKANANGEAISCNKEKGEITITSMRFSTFAVAYNEVAVPATGDRNNVWLYIILAAVAVLACAGVVVVRKLRKR